MPATDRPPRDKLGRRCKLGCHTWPDTHDYLICPACRESTDRYSDMAPLSAADAQSLKRLYAFEEFYEKWDSERDPDRLKP